MLSDYTLQQETNTLCIRYTIIADSNYVMCQLLLIRMQHKQNVICDPMIVLTQLNNIKILITLLNKCLIEISYETFSNLNAIIVKTVNTKLKFNRNLPHKSTNHCRLFITIHKRDVSVFRWLTKN